MMSIEKKPKLTVKEVAEELGVHERTVHRWIATGELETEGFDIHGRYVIARTAMDDLVRRKTQKRQK